MAKIERKNLKIFAKDAANNGQFGSAQVGTKVTTQDPETVQALDAWNQGWINSVIGGSKLPPLEELQSTTFVPTYHLAYIFQEGVPEWNGETTYYIGSWVKSGGTIYKSLTDNNLNNSIPDVVNWAILEATASDYGMVKRSSDFEATASDFGMVTRTADYASSTTEYGLISQTSDFSANETDYGLVPSYDYWEGSTDDGTLTIPASCPAQEYSWFKIKMTRIGNVVTGMVAYNVGTSAYTGTFSVDGYPMRFRSNSDNLSFSSMYKNSAYLSGTASDYNTGSTAFVLNSIDGGTTGRFSIYFSSTNAAWTTNFSSKTGSNGSWVGFSYLLTGE